MLVCIPRRASFFVGSAGIMRKADRIWRFYYRSILCDGLQRSDNRVGIELGFDSRGMVKLFRKD